MLASIQIASNLAKPDKLVFQLIKKLGLESHVVPGISIRPDLKIKPEIAVLFTVLDVNPVSLNLGGSWKSAIGTVGYDLSESLTIHGGLSVPWGSWMDTKQYGPFVGFEYRF